MNCPKCASVNTYVTAGMGACRTCGERWLPEGIKPYKGRKAGEEEMTRGLCENCGRGPMGITGHGLCGGCYTAVRKFKWGTPECNAALLEAKKRFSDPNYKRGRRREKTETGKPAAAKRAGLSNDAVIEHLQERRDKHLLIAKKLDEAIALLEI